jgi:hypothetical protein
LVIELCISFWWFAQQLAATMASFIATTVVARSDVSCQRLDHEVRLNDIAVNSSWLGMGFCGGNGGWWRFVTVFLQVRSLSGLWVSLTRFILEMDLFDEEGCVAWVWVSLI